jgi:hypothetical protein
MLLERHLRRWTYVVRREGQLWPGRFTKEEEEELLRDHWG